MINQARKRTTIQFRIHREVEFEETGRVPWERHNAPNGEHIWQGDKHIADITGSGSSKVARLVVEAYNCQLFEPKPIEVDIDCPAHKLVGNIHYCAIGTEGDLLCWQAYKHDCGWGKSKPDAESSSGRTVGFEPTDEGSTPSSAKPNNFIPDRSSE